ncbi:hypothetical protein ACWDA9_41570, partial [Streptomyces sp. NPDC001193]
MTISSMLGCIAAVRDTESPSQLSPALIQRMWARTLALLNAASTLFRSQRLTAALHGDEEPRIRAL